MAKYDFTNENATLKVAVEDEGGLYNPQFMVLATPSFNFQNSIIKLYDSGLYKETYFLANIGLIGATAPTTMEEAATLLNTLIGDILKAQGSGV